jgi:tellurite resistance-related uncharacterized protein
MMRAHKASRPQGQESYYMNELPADARAYKRTPTFSADTVPASLLREHSTKAGTWGLICVEQGQLRYVIPQEDSEYCAVLIPGQHGVIEPRQVHYVALESDDTQFYVEFYRREANDE